MESARGNDIKLNNVSFSNVLASNWKVENSIFVKCDISIIHFLSCLVLPMKTFINLKFVEYTLL